MLSPASIPLPLSPLPTSRRSSAAASRRSSVVSSLRSQPPPAVSPRTLLRPRLDRNQTITSLRQEEVDPFHEGSTITVNQPVGSLSISPSSRDICLASRKGLYILDLANLNNAPRFIPQGGTWQIADCQWSPHASTSNLILSTSSQKLLIWDLAAQTCLHRSIDAHARAITDINWHARNPNLMATVSMDAGIRGWDLRMKSTPFMRLCAWGAAGTQIKWNRQHEHILATAHGKEVIVWDNRKGSVPVTVIKAHDAKIYGIDWDRRHRNKLVTCSLDKTIKYWTIPELDPANSDRLYPDNDFFPDIPAPDMPTAVVSTTYPVWRARNLPFGRGVLSLPQRGEKALEMFGVGGEALERFEGHSDVVKEFVWRVRGGNDDSFEDREFQLVTWSKDRTLRIWPVDQETTQKAGYQYGSKIDVLVSRRHAADITYTIVPDAESKAPPAIVNPSGISRQKVVPKPEVGMTRGGGRIRGMDQLDWLTKVVKNKAVSETSAQASRVESESRHGSRGASMDREKISLKDEVVLVNKQFPKPKINFEKIDLSHRKLTITLNGPWANGDRPAFIRIHWSFSSTYPYSSDLPVFELEKNATVPNITRKKLVGTIQKMRSENRQCLVDTCAFLLGYHERTGRRLVEDSDSESEKDIPNVPMLKRTCGGVFGPNGALLKTALPRGRGSLSRSPSITRDQSSPLAKAMSILSRLENPRKNLITARRIKQRPLRRFESIPLAVQAGSTCTIHEVPGGNPDLSLARVYGFSAEVNAIKALEGKRLDHAEIWACVAGLLADPPPPYSLHPVLELEVNLRMERRQWELGIGRKRAIIDQIFETLIAARDVQLLAVLSCILLDHTQNTSIPPQPQSLLHQSPEQDYFTLPPHTSNSTPTRYRPSMNSPLSPNPAQMTAPGPGPSSYKTSGWSQILNPSSISLRGALSTPRERTSSAAESGFKFPLATSYEDGKTSPVGFAIPVPTRPAYSPRKIRGDSRTSLTAINSTSISGASGISPPQIGLTPLRSSGTGVGSGSGSGGAGTSGILGMGTMGMERSYGSSSDLRSHKVSFGSNSPLRRNFSRGMMSVNSNSERSGTGRRKGASCSVKIEIPSDDGPPPTLLRPEMMILCEAFKLFYADWLLRQNLVGARASLLQYDFLPEGTFTQANNAASGNLPLQQLEIRSVCSCCSSRLLSGEGVCENCKRSSLPVCSLCRLPIKGLSTTCTICTHTSHTRCFNRQISSTSHCPACPCECLHERGISGSFFSARLQPLPHPTIGISYSGTPDLGIRESYANVSKNGVGALGLSPEGDEGSIQHGSGGSGGGGGGGGQTAAKSLQAQVQALGLGYGKIGEGHGQGQGQSQSPNPSHNSNPAQHGSGREGLLGRAKLRGLTGDGYLNWKG